MIRLKTYKYGYFKILLLTFSINIVLQPCLGQGLNVSAPDGESDQELLLPALEEPDSLSQVQPEEPDSLSLAQPEESDSLSQAQPDSTDNDKVLKNRNIILSKALNYLDNHFYSIAGVVISVYFIFSQDEDKDASVSKVGPPPDWPNN
jgi:hypothetical protein